MARLMERIQSLDVTVEESNANLKRSRIDTLGITPKQRGESLALTLLAIPLYLVTHRLQLI
ncbi:hypothetical protein G293_00065 [Candidatus Liberibacter africanus PTSAPSY]|uniref:Uncharacterized protein n=1 Tax=Candidatus Liberibacter africanus PTSAPSY TaxID=1277257 RepID=A0A0G3I7I8_LIBAF|nr:hypothetical protein G293_00065 [Candidatus Liberibacter africanus PTSAPSY]